MFFVVDLHQIGEDLRQCRGAFWSNLWLVADATQSSMRTRHDDGTHMHLSEPFFFLSSKCVVEKCHLCFVQSNVFVANNNNRARSRLHLESDTTSAPSIGNLRWATLRQQVRDGLIVRSKFRNLQVCLSVFLAVIVWRNPQTLYLANNFLAAVGGFCRHCRMMPLSWGDGK